MNIRLQFSAAQPSATRRARPRPLAVWWIVLIAGGATLLAACDCGSDRAPGWVGNYLLRGTVTGLQTGRTVELQINGADTADVSANGSFTIATTLVGGSAYTVTVSAQPLGETCVLSNGSGVAGQANAATLRVACAASDYGVGGALSGMTSGSQVTLQDNGGSTLTLSANGSFRFSTSLAVGSKYAVTILRQPPGRACTVSNGSGTMPASSVTNVNVVCAGAWTWVGGASTNDAVGVYGPLGTAAANNAPGSRSNPTLWSDSSGSLWVFGGAGPGANRNLVSLNDLWSFNPITGQWTWKSGSNVAGAPGVYGAPGIASSSNVPGARYGAASWVDSSGNLWLFGAEGTDSQGNFGYLNDLWKFNPGASTWTWIGGSNTANSAGAYGPQGSPSSAYVPSSRYGALFWTDASGNFWLLGGVGIDSAGAYGYLNDLWKYNPTANSWDWVSGSSTANSSGVFGTQGTAAAGNVPSARSLSATWVDANGKLWLFGGYGADSSGTQGALNDLWTFDPTTAVWEWVGGSNINGAGGLYGTQGVASAGNIPGARYEPNSWTDPSGNLWLFGGYALPSSSAGGTLNDLWMFNPHTGTWTWVRGSDAANVAGSYGTLGVAAGSNMPGANVSAASITDAFGNFWLFGGYGYDSAGNLGYLNSLWKYVR